MFSKTLKILIAGAALLAPALSHTAFAQDLGSYPRVIESGENKNIEYGPGPGGNVFGGGAMIVTGTGDSYSVQYLDPSFVQAPRSGMVPVTVGTGESTETVWVPASEAPAHALARIVSGQQG